MDFTPLIQNRERCEFYGFIINGSPRLKCPTVQDADPRREASERELMGGDVPEIEGIVLSGNISFSRPGGWFVKVHGSGTGKVRGCYPNGKACSKWMEFSF